MVRAEILLCQLGRRPSRTGTLIGVGIVLLVTFTICFGLGPAAFAASPFAASLARRPHRGAHGLKQSLIFKGYVVGDDCEAEFPDDKVWYPGTVSAVNEDGTFTVTWDDPDGGPETTRIEPYKMKKVNVSQGYRHGDYVLAVFPDDGQWYPGIVSADNADGTFVVKWDDPDGGPEESEVRAKNIKVAPLAIDKLEVGAKYDGTIKSVKDYGAIVDIGAESDGFLHISCINGKRISNIYDHLQEGQQVEVWIVSIDKNKFRLTMVQGLTGRGAAKRNDFAAFEGVSEDRWLDGTVVAFTDYGAFVRTRSPDGSEATGMVHRSKIRDGPVDDVLSELKQGEKVKVRVESVNLFDRKLVLTMREPNFITRSVYLAQFEELSPDDWVNGEVTTITRYGAWVTVTLDDGHSADGMVHMTELSDQFANHASDVLEEGQQVEVRVLSVNSARGQLVLSMRGLRM